MEVSDPYQEFDGIFLEAVCNPDKFLKNLHIQPDDLVSQVVDIWVKLPFCSCFVIQKSGHYSSTH